MSDPQRTEVDVKVDRQASIDGQDSGNSANEAKTPPSQPQAPTANDNPAAERSGNEGGPK